MKLMKSLVERDIFGKEAAHIATIKLSRAYMRMLFEPFAILKEIDTNCNGTFNQSLASHLYHIEDNGPGTPAYKHDNSLITPVLSITHCRKLLNKLVTGVVKTERNVDTEKSKHGDFVCVDLETLIRLLLTGLGLTEKA